ncbi:MAG: hypothetical protein IPN42_11225 [Methylococcaceae bacterium]|nr:hypothetical protein [Methylococcaceae bacterium]
MAKYIKVYGERNTNTKYFSKLLELNLDIKEISGVAPPSVIKIQKLLPGDELVRDIYFYLTYARNLGWKHTCVKSVTQLQRYDLVNDDLVFVTITKNPYSWLLSLYRKPYHHAYTKRPDFITFLQSPWKTLGRDGVNKQLNNPVELWNIKNRSYLQLNEGRALNITTERLLENPASIIEQMSVRFGINRLGGAFVNYESATQDKRKDGSYYRDYYLNEKWKNDLPKLAIGLINDKLDRSLMSYFSYELLPV